MMKCFVMHSKSDNIGIMSNVKADEGVEKLSQWLFSRYQIWLEMSMKAEPILESKGMLVIFQKKGKKC